MVIFSLKKYYFECHEKVEIISFFLYYKINIKGLGRQVFLLPFAHQKRTRYSYLNIWNAYVLSINRRTFYEQNIIAYIDFNIFAIDINKLSDKKLYHFSIVLGHFIFIFIDRGSYFSVGIFTCVLSCYTLRCISLSIVIYI